MSDSTFTLTVDGIDTPALLRPLGHSPSSSGKTLTATGYGRRIPTDIVVRVGNRWRRVYWCIYSNSGTCYIDGPKGADGKRPWRVVH